MSVSTSSPSPAAVVSSQSLSPRSTTSTAPSSSVNGSDQQHRHRRPRFLLTEFMMQTLRKLYRAHSEFVWVDEENETRAMTPSGLARFLLTCTQPQGYDDSLSSLVALRRKLDVDSMMRDFGWVDYCGQRCLDQRGFLAWYKDFRNVHHVPSFVAAVRTDMAQFGIDCSKDKVLEVAQRKSHQQQQHKSSSTSSLSSASSSRRSSVSQAGQQPQQQERKAVVPKPNPSANEWKPKPSVEEWQVVPEAVAPRSYANNNSYYYYDNRQQQQQYNAGNKRRRNQGKNQQSEQPRQQQQKPQPVKEQSAYQWIGGVITALQLQGLFDPARDLIRYREKRQDVFRKRRVTEDEVSERKEGEAGAPARSTTTTSAKRPALSALLQRLEDIVASLDEPLAADDAHVVQALKRRVPAPRQEATVTTTKA